jgi:transcriptional regulator with XRE-family HTH domain
VLKNSHKYKFITFVIMEIHERIKLIRERKGLKQSDIADKIGIERSNYTLWEKKGKKLPLEQLEQIAVALEVSIKEILFSEQPKGNEWEIEKLIRENELLKKELQTYKTLFEIAEKDKQNQQKALELIEIVFELITKGVEFRFSPKSKKGDIEISKEGDRIGVSVIIDKSENPERLRITTFGLSSANENIQYFKDLLNSLNH